MSIAIHQKQWITTFPEQSNILIVDDDKEMMDELKDALSGYGYAIKGAGSIETGREAVKKKYV